MKTVASILTALFFGVNIYAQSPKLEWVNSIGGTGGDFGNAVTTDAHGNVYFAGSFQAWVDFDPGMDTLLFSSRNVLDIFIQKLDSTGKLIWAKHMGDYGTESATSISLDSQGNLYTVGFFEDSVDFDPGPGTFKLFAKNFYDIFIQKLDSNGNFIWAKSIGGYDLDMARSIVHDGNDNFYISGYFNSTVDFDPGSGVHNVSAIGDQDAFVLKMDLHGNLIWVRSFGGIEEEHAYCTALDNWGGVYTVGGFETTTDFDPGPGVFNQTSLGQDDIFIQKLDTNGNFVWAKTMRGILGDRARSIDTDDNGYIYSTGFFASTVDFDPSPAELKLEANNGDVFVQKLDTAGNFIWAKSFGGDWVDYGNSIHLNNQSEILLTGVCSRTPDFDPDPRFVYEKGGGIGDNAFIQKLDSNGCFIWANVMGGHNEARGHAVTTNAAGDIYNIGHYSQTADFDPSSGIENRSSNGGRDIFMQRLGECNTNLHTDTIEACDSYTWIDGITYTTSTTAIHVLDSFGGCNTTITLRLIIHPTSSNDVIESCHSYTWINGITYFRDTLGITDTLPNALGCDSIVTLYLTLSYPDTNIINTGFGLESADTLGRYQWLRCGSTGFTDVVGAIQRTYIPDSNGFYAVELSRNGCKDTSACLLFSNVGLHELPSEPVIQIYPNPSKGWVQIRFDEKDWVNKLVVLNSAGQVIYTKDKPEDSSKITLPKPGIYVVRAFTKNGTSTYKIVRY